MNIEDFLDKTHGLLNGCDHEYGVQCHQHHEKGNDLKRYDEDPFMFQSYSSMMNSKVK